MSLVLLRKALKDEKLVYGSDKVVKMIKLGKAKKIFVSSSFKDINLIRKYAEISKISLVELTELPTEIGLACKKQFPIGVLCY